MRKRGIKRRVWRRLTLSVAFDVTEMETLRRGGFRRQTVVTPVFRLPSGVTFTGRRASSALAQALKEASR